MERSLAFPECDFTRRHRESCLLRPVVDGRSRLDRRRMAAAFVWGPMTERTRQGLVNQSRVAAIRARPSVRRTPTSLACYIHPRILPATYIPHLDSTRSSCGHAIVEGARKPTSASHRKEPPHPGSPHWAAAGGRRCCGWGRREKWSGVRRERGQGYPSRGCVPVAICRGAVDEDKVLMDCTTTYRSRNSRMAAARDGRGWRI
ncbi:hypothetical protein DFH06DRAFT_626077 [Mycena polygramma]|nr:hypothetical protein DFH06DRAFT_626077 [Mycena polygramma]